MRTNWNQSRLLALLVLLSVFFIAKPSAALIIIEADGAGNTDAPPDDPGWDNVGRYGAASAMYLGDRWIITADHVEIVESARFTGQSFEVEAGSEITLRNPDGSNLSELTDLRLSRLELDPGLPAVKISTEPPPIDSDVIMIGRGRDREADPTMWNIDIFGDELIWTETTTPPFDISGFKWSTTQTKRWGTNLIDDDLRFEAGETDFDHTIIAPVDGLDVISLLTTFDEDELDGRTQFEAHATLGDSGGGVFYKNQGQWELAGIMFAVGVREGQPEDTAVLGNFTISADLSSYRDQIMEIIGDGNAMDVFLQPGDADQNLSFDQFDIISVLQSSKYLTGEPAVWSEGDWNAQTQGRPGNPPVGDGLFDQFDIIAALQAGTYLTGPYAALAPGGQRADAQASVVYHADSGEVSIDVPAGFDLTSVNVESASGIFTASPAQNLGGSFDVDSDHSIFKATFGGSFGALSFGTVAPVGLTESFLLDDISVVGSLAGGGGLGEVDLIYVPEPTAGMLLLLGVFFWTMWIFRVDARSRSLAQQHARPRE